MMKLVLSEEQVEELRVFISKGKKYGERERAVEDRIITVSYLKGCYIGKGSNSV